MHLFIHCQPIGGSSRKTPMMGSEKSGTGAFFQPVDTKQQHHCTLNTVMRQVSCPA